MHSFEHLVAEIREELRLRGLEHSSLILLSLLSNTPLTINHSNLKEKRRYC